MIFLLYELRWLLLAALILGVTCGFTARRFGRRKGRR